MGIGTRQVYKLVIFSVTAFIKGARLHFLVHYCHLQTGIIAKLLAEVCIMRDTIKINKDLNAATEDVKNSRNLICSLPLICNITDGLIK